MSGLFFSCLPANFLYLSSHLPIHLSIPQYVALLDEEKSAPRVNHLLVNRPSNAQEVREHRIIYTLQFSFLCILKLHVMLSSETRNESSDNCCRRSWHHGSCSDYL